MLPSDIANIERATITAVSPYAVEELPGWLLPFNTGTIGRAMFGQAGFQTARRYTYWRKRIMSIDRTSH